MRLLILLLALLLGLGGVYFALREAPTAPPISAGLDAAAAESDRGPLDLERAQPGGARTEAAAREPDVRPGGVDEPPPAAHPSSVNVESGKEPVFEGDAARDAVGSALPTTKGGSYAEKYAQASPAERAAALGVLELAFQEAADAATKDSPARMAAMKREMEWLQSNLDD